MKPNLNLLYSIITILCITFTVTWSVTLVSSNRNHAGDQTKSTSHVNEVKEEECLDDSVCADKLGFDAIVALHKILDDDENGAVDVSESDEFLREELQYENGYEKRHTAFHLNDKYISVKELWEAWKKSEVHNWTVEEAVEWLTSNVDLPQYVETFQEHGVDGSTLPRLAVNNMHFLTNILGIKDPIHKQKLALKAMDVVLFGAPRRGRNYIKDGVLIASIVMAVGGIWFAYLQYNYSQQHLKRMMKDLDSLHKAEETLTLMQDELDKARQEQQTATLEKLNLEQRLQDELSGSKRDLVHKDSDEDMLRLKAAEEQLRQMRDELRRAEKQLEDHRWFPPPSLQHWLQLTYELELRNFNSKKTVAEAQLASAKEGCEKLRKKRSNLLGAFRVAHGSAIDDVDSRIIQAKAALTEVTQDLKERTHRWQQIEALCGFSIVNNPGFMYLQSVLQGSSLNGGLHLRLLSHGTLSPGSLISASQDDLDDVDALSTYAPTISAVQQLVHTSASMFLASVPPSYAQTAWHTDTAPSRSSPPHQRDLRGVEGGSQPNLSSLISSSSISGHPHIGNGNMSPTVKRSRSAGAETLEPMMRYSHHHPNSSENLKAVIEEDNGMSVTNSTSSHDFERPVFSLGDSAITDAVAEVEIALTNINLKPTVAVNRFVKSHSQEHTLPLKEVHSTHHSNSESSLDMNIFRKKKSSSSLRSPVSNTILDEENSTDSGSIAEDDVKKERKRRFLPFRRSKHNS